MSNSSTQEFSSFEKTILDSTKTLPTPLVSLLLKFLDEDDSYRKVRRLVDCFEWIIKWHTSTTLSYLLGANLLSQSSAKGLRQLLAGAMPKPSLGHWILVFRAAKEFLGKHLPEWMEKETLLKVEGKYELTKLRNELSHGPFMDETTCRKRLDSYQKAFDLLLASPCLGLLLIVENKDRAGGGYILQGEDLKDCQLGTSKPPYIITSEDLASDVEGYSLWPFSDYAQDMQRKFGDMGFFYFNGLKGQKIEQVSYELPALLRSNSGWKEFNLRLPLREWKDSSQEELAHQRIVHLADNFVGREKERQELRNFCLGSDGDTKRSCLVRANPGAGKSALLATMCKELTENKSMEGEPIASKDLSLFPYFIGGAQEQDASYFLGSLIGWIDKLLGLQKRSTGSSVEELYRDLVDRFAQAQPVLEYSGKTLIIFVDGLDESKSIPKVIPKQLPPNIKTVCSGRIGHSVVEEYWNGLYRESRFSMEVGPLSFTDVKCILETVVHPLQEGFDQRWVRIIHEKSEGNPLYLKLLTEELFSQNVIVGETDCLPSEIQDLWEHCFYRLTADGEDSLAIKILRLLAVVKCPVSDLFISESLDEESPRCRKKILQLAELLEEGDPGDMAPKREYYHSRLGEWVRKENPRRCRKIVRSVLELCDDVDAPREAKEYSLHHMVSHLIEMELEDA